MICEYGCERDATHQLKSGKWCCSNSTSSCLMIRKINSQLLKGKRKEKPKIIVENIKCSFGCGKIAKYKFKNNKYCCSDHINKCQVRKDIISSQHKGKVLEDWHKNIIRKYMKGRPKTDECKIKLSFYKKEKHHAYGKPLPDGIRESTIERMKNGGAAYMNQFIKNPSKPQITLFKLCQELLPYPILNYPCLNYSIDIAIPKLNLAIEYDGSYWHKDIEKDIKRQKELENEGWLFLRYSDYIPDRKTFLSDIKRKL